MDVTEAEKAELAIYLKGHLCDFWSINPYRQCDLNCSYCVTRVQGSSTPVFSASRAAAAMEEFLLAIPPDLEIVLGGISDAYPHSEEQFRVTRAILEVLCQYNRRFAIITKSTLVERDTDLLLQSGRGRVTFSFSTIDDQDASLYEKNTPPPSSRMQTLRALHDRGIPVGVSVRPWIPGITDVEALLAASPDKIRFTIDRLWSMKGNRKFRVGNSVLTQQEIDESYLREAEKFRDDPRALWDYDPTFAQTGNQETHPVEIANHRFKHENQQLIVRNKRLPYGQRSLRSWMTALPSLLRQFSQR